MEDDEGTAFEIMGSMMKEANHRIIVLETVIAMLLNKSPSRQEIVNEITAVAEDCAEHESFEPASAIFYELLTKAEDMNNV
jgi:hypothetical protein